MWSGNGQQPSLLALAHHPAFRVEQVGHEAPIPRRMLLPLDALGLRYGVPREIALLDSPPEHRLDEVHILVPSRGGTPLSPQVREEQFDLILSDGADRRVAECVLTLGDERAEPL